MSRRVNVFVPTLVRNDAVSDQARRQVALLRRWGCDTALVAEAWDQWSEGEALPLPVGLARDRAAWVVHYSIWADGYHHVRAARGPKAFVYHNVTPPELLPGGRIADLCARARRALPGIAGGWDVVLAASGYSAEELRRAGFPDPEVVPLLIPNPEAAPEQERERGQGILFVGRIAPSKGVDDVIKAAALVRLLHRPGATLDIVGSAAGWERYLADLEALVSEIGCGGVAFRGQVSDRERDTLYRRCGAVLLLSRHEGFCAPIVEAMRAGAPVVAAEAGAVAETMGGGGLLLPSHDPRLAAEAVAEVLRDAGLRDRLRAGAGAALARVAPEAVEGRLRETLGAILPELSSIR